MSKKTAPAALLTLTGEKDNLLRACVNQALGSDQWLMTDIVKRMRRVHRVGEESETYMLDDKPLLEVWPITIEMVQDGDTMKIVASCKYLTFPPHPQSTTQKQPCPTVP